MQDADLFQINAVQQQQSRIAQPVKTCKREELVDARQRGALIFNLRQPRAGNQKLIVLFRLSDDFAEQRNFSGCHPELRTDVLQAFSRLWRLTRQA